MSAEGARIEAHICNKTKIKKLYKSCRTLAAYLRMLDFIHEHFVVANDSVAFAAPARSPIDCDVTGCCDTVISISRSRADLFYCSFIAIVRRPTIKEPTIKQKFVLLQFYYN